MIFSRRKSAQPSIERKPLAIAGTVIPLEIRRHARARRATLRLSVDGDHAIVTLPKGTSADDAVWLARRHAHWLSDKLAALPERVAFVDGAEVPYLGTLHPIRLNPNQTNVVRHNGEFRVGGPKTDAARRLTQFLRREARREITERVARHASRLGKRVGRISIRDTRSRWGSCSTTGNLSFSWRLIMAPADVLDYVAAHEVAHLAVPNHGPDFHFTLGTLVNDANSPRAWLRRNGTRLHRYG